MQKYAGKYYQKGATISWSKYIFKNNTPRLPLEIENTDPYDIFCYRPTRLTGVTHPLSAQEIINAISKRMGHSETTERDILEGVESNSIRINQSDIGNIKIILGNRATPDPFQRYFNFTPCEYSNCVVVNPYRLQDSSTYPRASQLAVTNAANIVLAQIHQAFIKPTDQMLNLRPDQYLAIFSWEATSWNDNTFPPQLDGLVNFTITHRDTSDVPSWHFYKGCRYKRKTKLQATNYAHNKTKVALAFISHCQSINYDRLKMVEALSKYVPVDVYGACGKPDPCSNGNKSCLYELSKKYYFYLSFENSLCKDYITEKFWERFSEPANMVPVAMGGLQIEEYSKLAPENSFIHVRNFTSIAELGNHLWYLVTNEAAYNRYHQWRETWEVTNLKLSMWLPACELCRIANEKPHMPADKTLSCKYNDKHCENYAAFPMSNKFNSAKWYI